jgi:hypothetical protein
MPASRKGWDIVDQYVDHGVRALLGEFVMGRAV